MKIAICFFGKFTGINLRGDEQGFKIPFEYLKKNILRDNIDIFFHGWNDNEEKGVELVNLFSPKKYILENQKKFDHPYKDYNFVPSGPWNTKDYINNNYSRFYSLKKSVELVDESYDLIMVSRFDTIFYEPIRFDLLYPENFYTTNWHKNNEGWGFNDAWFISGNLIMKKYSLIFDRLDEYFNLENSDYIRFLLDHGMSFDSLPSAHIISRYRCVEMGLTNNLYSIGLEYLTWGLLRRISIRNDLWGYIPDDLYTPKKI